MKNISIFFLALLSFTTGLQLRSEEHIRNRNNMLKHVDQFAEIFACEYKNYTRTGQRSSQLDAMFKMLKLPNIVMREEITDLPPEAALVSCMVCRSSLGLLIQQYRSGTRTQEQIMDDAVNLCMQFTDFGILVCQGVVDKNAVSRFLINFKIYKNLLAGHYFPHS